jgi:aldose sugar dehydrogenase
VDMNRETYVGGMRLRARNSTLATRIAYLDVVGPIAQARAEISVDTVTFVDYFNLLKTDEGWFIVDKVSTQIRRAPSTSAPAAAPPEPTLVTVMDSLRRPWGMAFLSDDEALISEKEGDLLRVNLRTRSKRPVRGFPRDMADSIGAYGFGDNTGKFDVAVDPDFAKTGIVFLAYAAKSGSGKTTKVVRARLRGDSLHDVQPILVATPFTPERYHFGGGLQIGHDSMLYVTVGGRLFSEGDEPALPISQDLGDRRGKIYRFRRDGTVPSDNPTFGPGSVPGLFAIGIRASQGLAVHPITHDVWFTEHGTHQGDEINVLRAGANYGWPLKTTGRYRDTTYSPPAPRGPLTDPVWSWPHTVAPTGPAFYTGAEFPTWTNSLFVGGLSRGSLWRMTVRDQQVVAAEELFVNERSRIRKVVQSPSGALYLLTDAVDGRVLQVRNAARPAGDHA